MKKQIFLFLLIIIMLLPSCTAPVQPVTADNVRTVSIPGFKDTMDADTIHIGSDGLEVCRVGTYTGTFVEQGTDVDCKDVPSIVVQNASDRMVEKAVLTCGSQTFFITYLPPDGICLVQNQSGKPAMTADRASNLMFSESVRFVTELSMHVERVRIETEENRVRITNISGEDIPGSVNVWYKTKQNGLYIGGVSYKAAVDDGVLKADSTATVQTSHFDPAYSELLLVTFSE